MRTGNLDADQAEERAWKEFANYLPDGLDSQDQYLFSVRATGSEANLGYVWVGVREQGGRRLAFLYNILI